MPLFVKQVIMEFTKMKKNGKLSTRILKTRQRTENLGIILSYNSVQKQSKQHDQPLYTLANLCIQFYSTDFCPLTGFRPL